MCGLPTGINLCGLPTGNNLCGLHSARVKPHKLIPVRRVQAAQINSCSQSASRCSARSQTQSSEGNLSACRHSSAQLSTCIEWHRRLSLPSQVITSPRYNAASHRLTAAALILIKVEPLSPAKDIYLIALYPPQIN